MLAKTKKQSIAIVNRQNKNDDGATWPTTQNDGELLLDVYHDANNIYVRSTMAGVRPENLEVSIHNDMLTIRGTRAHDETISRDDYFFQECYWGNFSRSIILPLDVRADEVSAVLRDGVLLVTLPKGKPQQKISINVKSDDK